MTPQQRERAEKLLELMGEEPVKSNWSKWLPIVIFLAMIAIYIAIMMFAPDWVKFLATGWVVGRVIWVNRDKIMSRFKK